MKIIGIETATDICGVCIIRDGKIIDTEELILFRDHAEKLPILVNKILKNNNLKMNDFNSVAVSNGPGSFTGLRIGLSFAKALAFSNNLPIVPIPTLYSIANNLDFTNSKIKILLHSHATNVYFQNFEIKNSEIKELSKPTLSSWDKLIFNNTDFKIFHYGCEKLIQSELIKPIKPSSKSIVKTANQEYNKFCMHDFGDLQPNYVSAFKIG